jgi:hypothetical protein
MKYNLDDDGKPQLKPVHGTWLIQRLSRPKGFVNPWGDVNSEINDDVLDKIIHPEYMGAAEYEFGVYNKCIAAMLKFGTKGKFHKIHDRLIHVVHTKGCDVNEIKEQIDYLYFGASIKKHNTGHYPEISKSDHSSFYREYEKFLVYDRKSMTTHGWLNVNKFYAFFLDEEMAMAFNEYCNVPQLEVAKK